MPELKTQPPSSKMFQLSFPTPNILLMTINRPKAMNSIPMAGHWEAASILDWFDSEPSLRVAIVTGAGKKAFSAGQDLIELSSVKKSPGKEGSHPSSGFLGISKRIGKKPIIAAVNGFALGGGFETCLNCDMVVASPLATFGLPEAQVGLYAAAGGLPRIVRTCGLHIASEIALTGRRLTAQEAFSYNVVNKVSQSPEAVVGDAVDLAMKVAAISPDAAIVTRHGLREAWNEGSVETAAKNTSDRYTDGLFQGENFKIGVDAFARKAKPEWVPSKL
ncbi:hypothetical protein BP5796_05461 [Coleophoma crateriformis]|uniref:Enoyl-CoA hydratase n=1 Tax=Coleophoma crateriformis TaxID=565419 RepID=A0A3D8S381_9HELO|nr:hypothetical protein BP5796_05461 [Coleophoma crateriformis]